MPIPGKYAAPLEPGAFYHIICKSLNRQNLFLNDENKRFFLQRYDHYLNNFLHTCCYILLDNHCHFLVQIKTIEAHICSIENNKRTLLQERFVNKDHLISADSLIERQFNSFFVSYTRSFNIFFKTKGHLFDSPFKRILVNDEAHLLQTVVYIHANAIKHQLERTFEENKWSSYKNFLKGSQLNPAQKKVLQWFGNEDQFVQTHLMQTEYYYKFDE